MWPTGNQWDRRTAINRRQRRSGDQPGPITAAEAVEGAAVVTWLTATPAGFA